MIGYKWLVFFVLLSSSTAMALDLTGVWKISASPDSTPEIYIRQIGDQVWLYVEGMTDNVTWASVSYGSVVNNTIVLNGADVPKGKATLNGTVSFDIVSDNELQVLNETGWDGGVWHKYKLVRVASEDAINLTGVWRLNTNLDSPPDLYFRQLGDQIWMYAEDMTDNVTWTDACYGNIVNDTVVLNCAGVPKGEGMLNGTITLRAISDNELQVINETGWNGGVWGKVTFTKVT